MRRYIKKGYGIIYWIPIYSTILLSKKKMAFEHDGLLLWIKHQRFQLYFGYKLTYGEYPLGTHWHLLGPLFDLQWAWQGREAAGKE